MRLSQFAGRHDWVVRWVIAFQTLLGGGDVRFDQEVGESLDGLH